MFPACLSMYFMIASHHEIKYNFQRMIITDFIYCFDDVFSEIFVSHIVYPFCYITDG